MTALLQGFHDLLIQASNSLPTPTPSSSTGSAVQATVTGSPAVTNTPTTGSTTSTVPNSTSTSDWTSQAIATVVAASIAAIAALFGLIAPFTKWSPTRKAADAAADAVEVNARSADAAHASAAAASKSADAALHSAEASDRNATAAGRRADQDALSKRYQEAANQLGHERAHVRLAGVYAMARLADDWLEQRQTCVDVLCAYLRMPGSSGMALEGADHDSDAEVRRTILRLLQTHLYHRAKMSWSTLDIDLSSVRFFDLRFENVNFEGRVSFKRAVFDGECRIMYAGFSAEADFSECKIQDSLLQLLSCDVNEHAKLDFTDAEIMEGASLSVEPAKFARGGYIDLSSVSVDGKLVVRFYPSHTPVGTLSFGGRISTHFTVGSGGSVILMCERYSSQQSMYLPSIFIAGWLLHDNAQIEVSDNIVDDECIDWHTPGIRERVTLRRFYGWEPSDQNPSPNG